MIVDDSLPSNVSHKHKALFTSPHHTLDLRYLVDAPEDTEEPTIELKATDLSERGLLGDAVTSDFVLTEGQVIYFVFREVGDYTYASQEHQKVANPDASRAQQLGLPLDKLMEATSKLRPKDNPVMSKVGWF